MLGLVTIVGALVMSNMASVNAVDLPGSGSNSSQVEQILEELENLAIV